MPPKRPQLVPASAARRQPAPDRSAAPKTSPPVHPFDALYATDTGQLIPATALRTGTPADRFVTAYYAVAPSIFRALLELWQHHAAPPFTLDRYSFLDIGAGKGRAVLLAAENPFVEVIGVELNPILVQVARINLASVAALGDRLAPMRLVEADALTIDLPPTPTVVFLFHPFEAPAMHRLLQRIDAQFRTRPGQLEVLYVNAEHAATIDRQPGFTQLWRGRIPMSTEDHLADLAEIATQLEYGSTGDELCAIYRYTGREI